MASVFLGLLKINFAVDDMPKLAWQILHGYPVELPLCVADILLLVLLLSLKQQSVFVCSLLFPRHVETYMGQ